jgi:hypothetical protein
MEKVPYASAVGSLMYAMVWTGPDIAHAIGRGEQKNQKTDETEETGKKITEKTEL